MKPDRKIPANFNKKNLVYLKAFLGKDTVKKFWRVATKMKSNGDIPEDYLKAYETVNGCLMAMNKFDDNRWWWSKNARKIAYHQVMNPLLLVSFNDFHRDFERLLGRPVWTHEFGLNWEGLKEEAERAYNGKQDTEEQRADSIRKSFEQLADTGKPVMVVAV